MSEDIEMPDIFTHIPREATLFVHPSFDVKELGKAFPNGELAGMRFVVTPHVPAGQAWLIEDAEGKPITLNPDLWPPSVEVRRTSGIVKLDGS
jgi:hypothetical protein